MYNLLTDNIRLTASPYSIDCPKVRTQRDTPMLTFASYLLVFILGGSFGAFTIGLFVAADDDRGEY